MARVVPEQKPGKSEQTVGTPREFIRAVEARWGSLTIDLAATKKNAKAKKFFTEEDNSFKKRWYGWGNAWLNPPFGDIKPWVAKAARTLPKLGKGDRIFVLTPASISAKWFRDYVHEKALVIGITRMKFVGHKHQFPKDLMLSVYGERPGFEVWEWRG